MKQSRGAIAVVVMLIMAGCCTVPDRQRATLRCEYPWDAGGFIGFYSFAGTLTLPITDPGQVGLVYYFNRGDCSEGALIGHDDCPGYLYPIGHKSWRQLARLTPPSAECESVAAICPLSKDKEGFAFWAKSGSGAFFLVRIKAIQPASYEDLVSGDIPALELEWCRPRMRKAG